MLLGEEHVCVGRREGAGHLLAKNEPERVDQAGGTLEVQLAAVPAKIFRGGRSFLESIANSFSNLVVSRRSARDPSWQWQLLVSAGLVGLHLLYVAHCTR